MQSLVPPDVTNVVSGTTNYAYSFVTNVTFYDYREVKTVQAVQLNVGKLNTWLTTSTSGKTIKFQNNSGITSKGHNINGVYVYNNVPSTGSQLPAVPRDERPAVASRRTNRGHAVPLYVMGDYNTTTNGATYSTALGDVANTVPAALMGDAVTVLSSSWNDSLYTSSYP